MERASTCACVGVCMGISMSKISLGAKRGFVCKERILKFKICQDQWNLLVPTYSRELRVLLCLANVGIEHRPVHRRHPFTLRWTDRPMDVQEAFHRDHHCAETLFYECKRRGQLQDLPLVTLAYWQSNPVYVRHTFGTIYVQSTSKCT